MYKKGEILMSEKYVAYESKSGNDWYKFAKPTWVDLQRIRSHHALTDFLSTGLRQGNSDICIQLIIADNINLTELC